MRSISWLEDDIGFVSTSADCTLAVWVLPRLSANATKPVKNVPMWTFAGDKHSEFLATCGIKLAKDESKEKYEKDLKYPHRIMVYATAND